MLITTAKEEFLIKNDNFCGRNFHAVQSLGILVLTKHLESFLYLYGGPQKSDDVLSSNS